MKNITIILCAILFLVSISCNLPERPQTKTPTIESIDTTTLSEKTLPVPTKKEEELFTSKDNKLIEEHLYAPLIDSTLILGMKIGINQTEFDAIMNSKKIKKQVYKYQEGEQYDHYYEFKFSEKIPHIYCHAHESVHDSTGLVGFYVRLIIKNDTALNRLTQELIDWGNEKDSIEKSGDIQLVKSRISDYQSKIMEDYKNLYGEPTIQDSNREAVWFIGRKIIRLNFDKVKTIIKRYEEEEKLYIINAVYEDLKLMQLYIDINNKEYKQGLNI